MAMGSMGLAMGSDGRWTPNADKATRLPRALRTPVRYPYPGLQPLSPEAHSSCPASDRKRRARRGRDSGPGLWRACNHGPGSPRANPRAGRSGLAVRELGRGGTSWARPRGAIRKATYPRRHGQLPKPPGGHVSSTGRYPAVLLLGRTAWTKGAAQAGRTTACSGSDHAPRDSDAHRRLLRSHDDRLMTLALVKAMSRSLIVLDTGDPYRELYRRTAASVASGRVARSGRTPELRPERRHRRAAGAWLKTQAQGYNTVIFFPTVSTPTWPARPMPATCVPGSALRAARGADVACCSWTGARPHLRLGPGGLWRAWATAGEVSWWEMDQGGPGRGAGTGAW